MAKDPKSNQDPNAQGPSGSGADPTAGASKPAGDPAPAPYPKAIFNSNAKKRERKTRRHKESGARCLPPGMFEIYKTTEWALRRLAEARGWKTLQVDYVRAAVLEGTTRIYLVPTRANDPIRIEILRTAKKTRINLAPFLEEHGIPIPLNSIDYHDLLEVNDHPEIGPALYFDIRTPYKVVKQKPRKRASSKEKPAPDSPGAQAGSVDDSANTAD